MYFTLFRIVDAQGSKTAFFMKILRLTIAAFAAGLVTSIAAQAQGTTSGATLIAVTGSATVTMPDGGTVAAVAGMALPEGAKVVTAADSKALIQTHPGIVAGLSASTTATVEQANTDANGMRNARIGVASGTLVSQLDPSKKSSNNYSVRTPRGVAAARGTIFSTSVVVNGNTYSVTINTITGSVTTTSVDPSTGATTTVDVGAGTSSTSNNGQQATNSTLTEALAGSGSAAVSEALQAAVAVAAIVAQATNTTGSTLAVDGAAASTALTTVLQQVTKAAAESGNTGLVQTTATLATQYAPNQAGSVATITAAITNSNASADVKTTATTSATTGAQTGAAAAPTTTVQVTTTTPSGTTTTTTTITTPNNANNAQGQTIDPGVIVVSPN
jgi:hypothetical protein